MFPVDNSEDTMVPAPDEEGEEDTIVPAPDEEGEEDTIVPAPDEEGEEDTMVSAPRSCLIPKDDREACGSGTVTEQECRDLGCCYDSTTYGTHWDLSKCYYGAGR